MPLAFTRDAGQFAREAGALVAARIEYNVMATVLAGVLAGEYAESPLFAYAADRAGAPGFAALRQPPWPLLVTDLTAAGVSRGARAADRMDEGVRARGRSRR